MILNKFLIIAIVIIIAVGIFTITSIPDQFADAGSTKKLHFTQTYTSTQDPGKGHENHQLALILAPNEGTIFDGSMTFTASEPVQVVVLHEITPDQARGQPTWTVDGQTIFGLSLINLNEKSGSFEFTGAALALHSPNPTPFTATVSVDGWIRGQPTEILMQKIEALPEEPSLSLSRSNVPATIPMNKGFFNGEEVFFIITDSSDKEYADIISEKQGWRAELAPSLSNAPDNALQTIYVFRDGVNGDGIHGLQNEVFSSIPSESGYSALSKIVEVTWKKGQNKIVLESEGERIELTETKVVINTPHIVWPGGQMQVRDDLEISDDLEYGGGQITEINEDEMTVTFVAHRGWGPNGETIYYIVTDATPKGPAEIMGVTDASTLSSMIANSAAVDLFQFENGIKGSGPLGFQPGIGLAAPGDGNYSPIWRIYLVSWNNPEDAKLLETKSDIDAMKKQDLISVSIARPMNSDHLVNCPFIDPFQ